MRLKMKIFLPFLPLLTKLAADGAFNYLQEGSRSMTRRLRSAVLLSCGVLMVLSVLQLGGCTQVERLKATVADDIAYQRGNQVLAKDQQAEAAAQYRIAAEAGHAKAQYKLGLMAASGSGLPQNKTDAFKWMSRSAEQGYAPAQQMLGTWYFAGGTAPQNSAEAARWFRAAAAQKEAASMYFLGTMYARGEGVQKDHQAALGWFRQAADNGFPVPAEYLTMAGMGALERKAPGSRQARAMASAPAASDRQALVKEIQAGLATLGYKPGPADGLMGKKTANAISAFQKDNGLPVDGSISEELLKRIKEKMNT